MVTPPQDLPMSYFFFSSLSPLGYKLFSLMEMHILPGIYITLPKEVIFSAPTQGFKTKLRILVDIRPTHVGHPDYLLYIEGITLPICIQGL